MYTKVVSVLSNATTGTQDITFTPNGSDPSWTPKAAIVTWHAVNTSLNTFVDAVSFGYGFTDGTNQYAIGTAAEDNTASSDTARYATDSALILGLTFSGTIGNPYGRAAFSSWLTNGMRVNWDVVPGSGIQFYLTITFLGGSDITNVTAGTITVDNSHSAFTVNTLGYKPDWGLFLFGRNNGYNSGTSNGAMCVGTADKDLNQWTQWYYDDDNNGTNITRTAYAHDKIITTGLTSVDAYATLSSWNTDGFTISTPDAFGAVFVLPYLVIKGGGIKVGNATEPASTGTQEITTGLDTKTVMIFGIDSGSPNTFTDAGMWTCGMGDGTNNKFCNVSDQVYNSDPMANASRVDNGCIYINASANATASSSTIDDQATLYALGSSSFTLNWTNIGNARPFRYIAFGTAVLSVTKTLTLKYSGIQQITDTNTLRWDIRKEITDTTTLRWDIRKEITKTLTLLFHELSEVTKSLSLLFNIEAATAPVTKTLTLISDIRQEVTKPLTLRYDGLMEVEKSITLLQNIYKEITKTLTLRHDVSEEVEKTVTLIQNIQHEVTKPVTLRHDILMEVEKSLTLLQNIEEEVTKLLTLRQDINSETTKSLTLRWNEEQQITKQLTLINNISSVVEKSLTIRYDILSEIFQVVKTLTLRFSGEAQVTKSLTLIQDILNSVTRQLSLIYDVSNEVTKSLTLIQNIEQQTTKSLTIRQDIIQEVTKQMTLRHDILQAISKSLTVIFDVAGLVTTVKLIKKNTASSDLTDTRQIDGTAGTTQTVSQTITKNTNYDFQWATEPSYFTWNDWQNGTWTWRLRVTQNSSAGTSTLLTVTIERISNDGQTIRASKAANPNTVITTAGLYSGTIDWSDGTQNPAGRQSNDRIRIKYTVRQTGQNGTVYVGTNLEDNNDEIGNPISLILTATKVLNLLFSGMGQTTKTNTLRFDVTTPVTKTLTLLFSTLTETEKQLTLMFDGISQTIRTLTTRFDTLTETSKSLTLRQDILVEISKSLSLLYNIEGALQQVTKTLSLLFSGGGQTTKSTTIRFDVATELVKTLTLLQDIRQEITKQTTIRWDERQETTKSLTLIQDILAPVTKTLTLRNDILTQTTKSLTLRNDILIEAMKTITLRQNILAEAIKSLSVRFGIEGPIVKILTLRFDVIAETTKSLTLKFNLVLDVTKQVNLLFSIIGQTTKSLTIPFGIEAEVTKTITLIQNIVGEVLRTVTLRFDVLKETSKSLTLRQDVIQETTKSVTLRQNILSEVEKDVTILYGILQEVPIVSKTLRFNIEQQITKQLRLLSDIQAQTTKQLRIRFDVKSILIKNMAEKLLDCLFNRYTLALPTKSSILWHEWYNGQNDICISCLPMTVIPIERESTMVYKKRHYVCSLHIFYRHVLDNPNENTPAQLANLTRHIHNLLLANRFNPNFLGAIDAKAVEVRIRDADYIPDPDERGTGVPSPRIYHYRWILEIVYHKIV